MLVGCYLHIAAGDAVGLISVRALYRIVPNTRAVREWEVGVRLFGVAAFGNKEK